MVGENQQGERLGGRRRQNEKMYSELFKTQNQRIENKLQFCYRKTIEKELKKLRTIPKIFCVNHKNVILNNSSTKLELHCKKRFSLYTSCNKSWYLDKDTTL